MEVISLLVRLFCAAFAVLNLLYMGVFVLDIQLLLSLVPEDYHNLVNQLLTINHKPEWNSHCLPFFSVTPSLNNTVLVSLFGLQHSAMLRGPLKKVLSLFLSESYQRSVYVFASGFCLCLMYFLWIPMTEVVWHVTHPYALAVVYAFMLFSAGGVAFSLLNLNPIQLYGIAKVTKGAPGKLITSGLYGFVRHPIYTFSLMLLWITPLLSVGHLLLASMFTVYVVYAVAMFEEPDLVTEFGPDYVEYMETTPRFIPWFSKQKSG